MDAPVSIPREASPKTVFLRSEVLASHPSASILGQERMGIGVAVASDRVLTAHYLVLGARTIEVTAFDGRTRPVLRCGVDHETGLALLVTDGAPLRAARLASVEEVLPGAPVFLITCTTEQERRTASGHISRVGPFEAFWEYMLDRAIMTTALNPGLAGAPLFSGSGTLMGIVSLGLSAVGRYSLAIPAELYTRRLDVLLGEPDPGRAKRAWLGFFPREYDGGVILTGLVENGPADAAGLRRGDLLLSVDGESVTGLRDLYTAVWRRQPGDALSLQVLRDSTIRTIEAIAGDRDRFYE